MYTTSIAFQTVRRQAGPHAGGDRFVRQWRAGGVTSAYTGCEACIGTSRCPQAAGRRWRASRSTSAHAPAKDGLNGPIGPILPGIIDLAKGGASGYSTVFVRDWVLHGQ